MTIASDLRTAVANALAGGSTDAGGVRITVDTVLHKPSPYHAASCWTESARRTLPAVFHGYFGARPPSLEDGYDSRTDDVALFEAADGSIFVVARVKP